MRGALLLVALLAACPAAAAEVPSGDALARALSSQPGVTLTQGVEHGFNRDQAYTEWRKNGVFYRCLQGDGKGQCFGDDETGRGAVMCNWITDVTVRAALDDCPADRFVELRNDLDRDILAMEAFIVANSVLPTTIGALRAIAAAEKARNRAARPLSEPRTCAAGDAGAFIAALDGMGHAGRRAATDKLLSVPRWPVSNPCL